MQHSISTTTVSSHLNRRQFLRGVAGLGLSASVLVLLDSCGSQPTAPGTAKETLETTTVRLSQSLPSLCLAPQYLAEELLRREGFTNIQYVKTEGGAIEKPLASGDVDISMIFAAPGVILVDGGAPISILAGMHVGCFELFGTEQIRAIRDLKGKTVPVSALSASQYFFLATIVAYVGLDPKKDINWVVHPPAEASRMLADGKVDAFLAFPPTGQELRAHKIGHVMLNSMMDAPWSHYFCCLVAANQEFMQQNPVATKRALRALLQASDLCAREPERAARFMVDKGYTKSYDYALEALKEIPYNKWREFDPTDTLRFYALRLRDAGMVKSTPDEIIARGTDWRFLNELKKELPTWASSANTDELLCRVGEPG